MTALVISKLTEEFLNTAIEKWSSGRDATDQYFTVDQEIVIRDEDLQLVIVNLMVYENDSITVALHLANGYLKQKFDFTDFKKDNKLDCTLLHSAVMEYIKDKISEAMKGIITQYKAFISSMTLG